MYNFILSMWKQSKITIEDLEAFVGKGVITTKQAKAIKAEKQISNDN